MPSLLRKVSRTVFADRSGTDNSQVPVAVSSGIKVYKQGATVTTTGPTTIAGGGGTTISVRNSGGLIVGDTVQKGSSGTNTATVGAVVSPTSVTLVAASGTLSVSIGDRLVVTTDRPTLYTEASGSVAVGSSNVDTNAAGLGTFYTPTPRVDIIYSGTGITTATEYDVEAGYLEPNPWIDIRAYGNSITRAIAALPNGGTIYMPAGTYEITGTVTINTGGIHLLGDTSGVTTIQPSANNPAYHMFEINKGSFRAEHINFNGRATTSGGTKDIMRWNGYGITGNQVQSMYLNECYFYAAQRTCLRVTDTFECVVTKCIFGDCPDMALTDAAVILQSSAVSTDPVNDGVHTPQFAHFRFFETRFVGLNGFGILADTCSGVHVDSCRFEVNSGGTAANRGNGLAIISSTQVSVHKCHFENPTTSPTRANQFTYIGACRAVSLLCNSWIVIGGDAGSQLKPAQACLVETVNGAFIGGNQSSGMNAAGVVIASDSDNIVLCATEDYGTATDADRMDNATTNFFGSVVTVPRYTTANLPAWVSGRVQVGSLAYDTTTDNLKVIDNSHAWVKVGTQA